MNKILISACLLGWEVRYNGSSLALSSQILDRWLLEDRILPSCPEVDGGMVIPRAPAEITEGEGLDVLEGRSCVADINGLDVTEYFVRGAETALKLCREHNIKVAVLADGSPSCGSSLIYNGRFEAVKNAGAGVTAALLRQHGIQVFTQHSIKEADSALHSIDS
ncbi:MULTISPECIES: DUF523 domain-containing protein [unclassified Oceanispirochaeta]|uniref:DUF523 domain-containing protein n=1 Tax=unclassified Oceanispirochaeta TaxID=2635722 RepID=UPI000E093311|nr:MULTISPECIES: DUF523 domain-containing protein [unclassified Oceanispirochaeta]MBF9016344.1 DUF523 domain-containing protein [Oceanispirochaeta sp. M2]NPD72806.1 DUF523 domain-containing protein [Oceanispirochaeta sp. M1]RDG31650.1 DUF523 domain-containing protein [Oceanispirochaeta sp. M1]